MDIHALRANEIAYCHDHPVYFVDKYGHIEDKNADELIQPFKMWKEQRDALDSIHKHKLNAILKARQLGFSWLVLHYGASVLLKAGTTVIGLSRTEEEAKELIRRMAVILRYAKALIAEKGAEPQGWKDAWFEFTALELRIHHPNAPDSVFKCFPSSPNAARSFTANLIIFDEWAFQPFAEEIFTSGFPTINSPTGGQVVGLSTIERGSFFEKIFTDPDNKFNKIFIPWYADPRRDEQWYEDTRRTIGDQITREYPASIEEALTVPGGSFFPEVKRDTHISLEEFHGLYRNYVCIDYGLDMFSAHWIHVNEKGFAQVYREYDKPNLTIGEACAVLKDYESGEKIDLYLAPPDLWNRSQESGKSRALLFNEHGISLTKTSKDFPAGCASMKEWLRSERGEQAKLTILDGKAPNLYRCLQKIQKDKKRENVYAKDPHDLTHDPDSLRCFCVYYIRSPRVEKQNVKKNWHKSLLEDYDNASAEDKEYLLEKYGGLK